MVLDLLKAIVEKYPENIAIEFGEHKIPYQKLQVIINKLANSLIQSGIKKGDRVAVLLPNVPHFIFSYYAILKIGAILVPISPVTRDNDLDWIIKETQPNTLIALEGLYRRKNEFKNLVILGEKLPPGSKSLTRLIANGSDDEPEVEVDADDTAIIQFTAGIVEVPRGVELTHRNIASAVQSCIKLYDTSTEDTYAGLLPLFLLYTQNMVMNSALLQGARLVLYPKFNLELLNQAVFDDKVTFLTGSPRMFAMFLEQAIASDHSLRYVLSFGSPCENNLLQAFEEKFKIPILEGYGVTESSAIISYNRPGPFRKVGSVGLPLNNIEIKIVDDEEVELEREEIGEIVVRGNNVMKGYWNQPEKTANVLKDGWFYTGDLGKIDEEGFLYFIERKPDVILKGGFHIYPREVENILLEHPKVAQVAIVGVAHPVHKQEVKACIVLKKDQQATAEEISDFIKEKAPVYKCPQIIEFYKSLPKSVTGRIIKRKLKH